MSPERLARLTDAQAGCLRLCWHGLSNAEMARRTYRSTFTVRHHLADAYARLGLTGQTDPRTQAALALFLHEHPQSVLTFGAV